MYFQLMTSLNVVHAEVEKGSAVETNVPATFIASMQSCHHEIECMYIYIERAVHAQIDQTLQYADSGLATPD